MIITTGRIISVVYYTCEPIGSVESSDSKDSAEVCNGNKSKG